MVLRTLGALTLQLVGVAAALAWHVSVTSMLGASASGTLFLAVSLATTVGVLTRFGADTYLVSTIAHSVASGRLVDASRSYLSGLVVALGASLTFGVAAFLLAGQVGRLFNSSEPLLLVGLSLCLLLAANLYTLSSAALRGLGAVESSVMVLAVVPHLASFAIFWTTGVVDLGGASVALLAGWTVAAAIGLVLTLRQVRPIALNHATPSRFLRNTAGFYKVAVAQMLINSSAPLLVGALSSPRDVALYTVAARVAQVVALVQVAINTVVGPRIVADLTANQPEAAYEKLAKSTKLAASVGLAFLVFIVALGFPILSVFGPEFSDAQPYMLLLAVGQFLNVSAGCLGYALLLTSNEELVKRNVVLFGGVFAVSALLCGLRWGGMGVALAASVALGTQNIALFIVAKKSVPWLRRGRIGP